MDFADFGLRYLRQIEETIVDGEGLRFALYLSGCRHRCAGCQNADSWNPIYGQLLDDRTLDGIYAKIRANPLLDGLTLSGGDPFYNPEALLELVTRLKAETGANIWCFTGYTIEELAANPILRAPLQHIDVLVDGPYIQALRALELNFRGSSNQRIIRSPWSEAQRLIPHAAPEGSTKVR